MDPILHFNVSDWRHYISTLLRQLPPRPAALNPRHTKTGLLSWRRISASPALPSQQKGWKRYDVVGSVTWIHVVGSKQNQIQGPRPLANPRRRDQKAAPIAPLCSPAGMACGSTRKNTRGKSSKWKIFWGNCPNLYSSSSVFPLQNTHG